MSSGIVCYLSIFYYKNKILRVDSQGCIISTFDSIKKAAKESKMGEGTVKKCCEQGKSDKDGLFWKYT
jgi:hypothetical protein